MSGLPRNDTNFASVGTDYSSPQYSSGNNTTNNTSPQYSSGNNNTDNTSPQYPPSTKATDNSSTQYSTDTNTANNTDYSSPQYSAGTHTTHGTDFNNPAHHVRHDESEPLPGAQGARDTVDYGAESLGNDNTSWTRDKHTAAADFSSTNERRNDSERLPSALGGRDTVDDRADNLGNDNTSWTRDKHTTDTNSSSNNERSNLGSTASEIPGGRTDAFEDNFSRQDDPTHAGFGKGLDAGETKGHAGMGDKVIGKTQQMVGKITNNADLREKGELRETSGKEGTYRAPRD